MAIDKSDTGFSKQVCLCHNFCKIRNVFHKKNISDIAICMKGDYDDKKHSAITTFELEILILKLFCSNSFSFTLLILSDCFHLDPKNYYAFFPPPIFANRREWITLHTLC